MDGHTKAMLMSWALAYLMVSFLFFIASKRKDFSNWKSSLKTLGMFLVWPVFYVAVPVVRVIRESPTSIREFFRELRESAKKEFLDFC